MGAYKYITETFQRQYKERDETYRAKLLAWRRQPAMTKLERPTNIPRARRLGYQAKMGYAVIRIRIGKGRRRRPKFMGGRKSRHNYQYVQTQLSHQAIAEQRANRHYPNMEVLNSYWVGEDGLSKYFEVILADRNHPAVKTTSVLRLKKAYRGLTSAGKKARGIGR